MPYTIPVLKWGFRELYTERTRMRFPDAQGLTNTRNMRWFRKGFLAESNEIPILEGPYRVPE